MIHDFNNSVVQLNNGISTRPAPLHPIGLTQSSDLATPVIGSISMPKPGQTDILTGNQMWTAPSDIHDFTEPALRPLEESLKMFFSGIRVPYKDGYRMLRMRIANPQRSLSVWRDELLDGRATIPVGAIVRGGFDYDRTRYAPPYHPMAYRYNNRSGTSVSMIYKPTPINVTYSLSVMTESKTDEGHCMTSIMRRFQSGIAEFIVNSAYSQWVARANYTGSDTQTEQRVDDGAKSFVVTVYKMSVEAWLPLPERSVPTALVINKQIEAMDGTILSQQNAWG